MIVYPNAKINLGLNITARRTDGFHDIETCFIPIDLTDILEFTESESPTSFQSSGFFIPGNPLENLCIAAWKLLHNDFQLPQVAIYLHKQIPIGAGLGGGSSDAAFMLKGLSDYFGLQLGSDKLKIYAAKLGSDCSFFIDNKPAFAKGKGELLEPMDINLAAYKIALVNPGIHIPTKEAYSMIKPGIPQHGIKEILKSPVEEWSTKITNDFEAFAFSKYPEIAAVKEKLMDIGAVFALMTGSGSSVFGIFNQHVPETISETFDGMFVWFEK